MSEKYFNDTPEQDIIAKERKGGVNAGLIILLLGLVITVIGIVMCNNIDLDKYYKTMDYNTSLNADKVKNICIDNNVVDYTIKKGSGKDITIEGKNVPESFKAEINGDTLNITSHKKNEFWLSLPMLTHKSSSVEVILPEKEYNNLTLKASAGDVDISEMKFQDIRYETGAGDSTFSNVSCGKFVASYGAGDSKVNNLTCDSCEFDTGAGDIVLTDINCKNVMDIDSGAGDVDIVKANVGGLEGDIGAGNFTFNGTIDGDIRIDSGAGDVELNLTNSESDFGKNGKYKMTIDNGVGDKEVTYNN